MTAVVCPGGVTEHTATPGTVDGGVPRPQVPNVPPDATLLAPCCVTETWQGHGAAGDADALGAADGAETTGVGVGVGVAPELEPPVGPDVAPPLIAGHESAVAEEVVAKEHTIWVLPEDGTFEPPQPANVAARKTAQKNCV